MAQKHRSKWQWFFIILIAVAFAVLLISNRQQIKETMELLKRLDWRIVVLLPLMQLTSYFFIANYYRAFLRALDKKVRIWPTYAMVVSLFFIEQVLPSGGASGITYIAYAMRRVATAGTTTLIQLSRYLFNFLAYFFIVPMGIFLLLIQDPVNEQAVEYGVILLVILAVSGGITVYLLSNQRHIEHFASGVSHFVNWLAHKFLRRDSKGLIDEQSIKKSLNDFHEGVQTIGASKQRFVRPFCFMLMSTFMQLSIVYLSFVAVGQAINPGLVVVAFAIANLVGVISVIPGDVGVHEAAMIFVLSTAGVDQPVAISATLLYRVFNKLVMLTIGFGFYARFLRPNSGHKL